MHTPIRKELDWWIVEPKDRLDDNPSFADDITRLLEDARTSIVIDLSRVTMITSAGLGLLVQLTARANTQGARLVLASPSPFVSGVLQTTRLQKYFETYADVSDAMRSIPE